MPLAKGSEIPEPLLTICPLILSESRLADNSLPDFVPLSSFVNRGNDSNPPRFLSTLFLFAIRASELARESPIPYNPRNSLNRHKLRGL
jgi:hypothetical protein